MLLLLLPLLAPRPWASRICVSVVPLWPGWLRFLLSPSGVVLAFLKSQAMALLQTRLAVGLGSATGNLLLAVLRRVPVEAVLLFTFAPLRRGVCIALPPKPVVFSAPARDAHSLTHGGGLANTTGQLHKMPGVLHRV